MLIVSIGEKDFAIAAMADAESLMRILSEARQVEMRTFHMLDGSPAAMHDRPNQVEITLRISRAKLVSVDAFAELERQNDEAYNARQLQIEGI